MVRRSALRASDADREHTAERLRKAAAEGRLVPDELEQRLGAAFAARTYGELDAVVADLPDDRLAAPAPRSLARMGGPLRALAIGLAAALVVAVVALIVTGTVLAGGAWIFLGLWFFGCRGARCRARYSRHSRSGGWQQVGGANDRGAWL